jgi:hypothetical protein
VTVVEEGQLATKTSGNAWSTVFGGQQLIAGVHYMEVEVEGDMFLFVGIARPGLDTADGKVYAKKECMDGWFMRALNGSLYANGKNDDEAAGGFEAGDRIGLLVDLDQGSLLFFKNGKKHGPGYGAGLVSGPVVLAMQMFHKDQRGRVVADAVIPSARIRRRGLVSRQRTSYEGPEAVLGASTVETEAVLGASTVETVRARTVFVACAGAVVIVWALALLPADTLLLIHCCSYAAAHTLLLIHCC